MSGKYDKRGVGQKNMSPATFWKMVSVFLGVLVIFSIGYRLGKSTAPVTSEVDRLSVDNLVAGFKSQYPANEVAEDVAEQVSETSETEHEEEGAESEEMEDDGENEQEEEEESENEVTESSSTGTQQLFVDQKEFDAAPYISLPPKTIRTTSLWWALGIYEREYSRHPVKRYVPRMRKDIQITREMFEEHFISRAQPVIFSFENLRDLGFSTRSFTMEELQSMFPYVPSTPDSPAVQAFLANGVYKDDVEIDLGPAIASIVRDEKLAKAGKMRNFPRNLKVKESAIQRLGIEKPPLYEDMSKFQLPTVWMGTSSSDTRFHHDATDNYVFMISGTKRFTLAPTTDWRTLDPTCVGKFKSLCWASVAHPNAEVQPARVQKIMKNVNKVVVDVAPGEILFMPAGWFHHIQNLGPTVMVNWWTKGVNAVGLKKWSKIRAAKGKV